MPARRSKLLSLPYVSLYVAAIVAVILNATRGRWGDRPGFLILAGLDAALAVSALRHLFKRKMVQPSAPSRYGRAVLFLLFAVGLPVAAAAFLDRSDAALIAGLLLMAALFLYAGLGTLLYWPGFRAPPTPDEDNPILL